jgi:menaquinone-dependent protoporphyrinogen IX oxidase
MNGKSIAVIYKSNYGTTKKYANWIATELRKVLKLEDYVDLLERKEASVSILKKYDVVIYGGGLYASGIIGAELVAKNPTNNLILFTVGLADPQTTDYSKILNKNFPKKEFQPKKVFHFRGGIDYKKLNFTHRGLMALLKKTVEKKKKEELNEEEKAILETYGEKIDFTDRQTITELISYVSEIE